MLTRFDELCEKENKIAFVDEKKTKYFKELKSDVLKMISLFKKEGIKEYDKCVLFLLPSYEFYALLIAGIYYHLDMIVIDSFKNKEKLKSMLDDSEPNFIFTNSLTKFISFILPSKARRVNISKYNKFNPTDYKFISDENSVVLTTYTSGTTGNPKRIERSLKLLKMQMDLILKNIDIEGAKVIYATLPIYVLLSMINGCTTLVGTKISDRLLEEYKPDIMLTSIKNLLSLIKPIECVNKAYCGGAILYRKEALKIKNLLPNAIVTYVYGSSEGVLIAKTTLDKYIENNCFTFDEFIDGINVSITPNNEIIISGESVLTEDKTHNTRDMGIINNEKLKVVGRVKYSSKDFSNYVVDQMVLDENKNIKKAFSFMYKNKKCLAYEGVLEKQYDFDIMLKYRHLPYDLKHKTKLDYSKVIEKIEKDSQ